MAATARKLNKIVIGPATVGGMAAGASAGTPPAPSKYHRLQALPAWMRGLRLKSGSMLNEAQYHLQKHRWHL